MRQIFSRLPDEPPEALVQRLALQKAEAVASSHPDALIIGSDQVACLDELVLGKPATMKRPENSLDTAQAER